jgi:hypothetical protein
MAINEILKFCEVTLPGSTNLLTQAEYTADTERTEGNTAGSIASSKLNNKLGRQNSTIASGLGEFIANNQSIDVTDDLTAVEVGDMTQEAINVLTYTADRNLTYVYAVASGSANAILLNPTTPYVSFLNNPSLIRFKALATNTGSTTVNISGIGVIPIRVKTPAGLRLTVPNQIISNSIYELIYDGIEAQLINPSTQEIFTTYMGMNGSQAVTSGVGVNTIQFNHIVADSLGWASTGGHSITPTITGHYQLDAAIFVDGASFSGPNNSTISLALEMFIGSAFHSRLSETAQHNINGMGNALLSGSYIMKLNAGNAVHLNFFMSSSGGGQITIHDDATPGAWAKFVLTYLGA